MQRSIWSRAAGLIAASALFLAWTSALVAFQVRPKTSRFDAKVIQDPTSSIAVVATGPNDLPANDGVRRGWDRFRVANGSWTVHLDRRSGAPLLVEGQGIRFPVAPGATVESIGAGLRSFIAANKTLLKAEDAELVLDHDASGTITPDVWQVVFKRKIAGVPVAGERYVFTIGHGNLIAFGAPRWSRIDSSPYPRIDAAEALGRLTAYMSLTPVDSIKIVDKGSLELIPLDGTSMGSALVWRVVLRVEGEIGTWAALVDAHTGEIRSFRDINDYAQVRGGVYPVANDGILPDGVEQANWPMPFAEIDLGDQITNSTGQFQCTPNGAIAMTPLAGQYVRILDTCGAISASVTCDADIDLGTSGGTDCDTPGFGGPGNTHAARTGFYHLNRIAEHARAWLPSRIWLTQQVTSNVNINQTCNAYWNGTANFFRSGGEFANTGEIVGIFNHEWGHGLDSNDGGGVDSPAEAYADVVAMLSTHTSCIGRGFTPASNCTGYGDTCLNCTGIRDQDWDQRAAHTPATPSGFVTEFCPVEGTLGPCGTEIHCEGYVAAETIWDLATRDLPASGMDVASSWQLVDKLWYKSRLGSGGNAYNCVLPNSDGCAATSWFTKLRVIDDDDGNLANGTPHAAAIFGAFNRHEIACGLAGDASNQNTSACPAIGAPVLSSIAGSGAAGLNWTSVPNAASYHILRNDASCDGSFTIMATITSATTTYTDSGLANGFPEHYRVQAVGANTACDGPVSNCATVIPQPFAGVLKFDKAIYRCSDLVTVKVSDGNIGGATATVSITSATEPGGEMITVTQVGSSADYVGTIATTSAPAAADGAISVVAADTITGSYVDADDGIGGVNVPRQTSAATDCVFPVISNVVSSQVTGSSARITWNTDEASNSTVDYGLAPPPPGFSSSVAAPVTAHVVDLTGLSECSSYRYSVASTDAVGNKTVDDAGGAHFAFATVKNTTPSFASTDTPVLVPDNSPVGGSSAIDVPHNKPVVSARVKVNITHPYVGDLTITLTPPVGPAITLFDQEPNSSLDHFIDTVFDDTAATSIEDGTAPFTGPFRPVSPLSAVNGINAAGTWTLKVVDSGLTDSGTLDDWTLMLVYPPASCGPHAVLQSSASVNDTCGTGGAGDADAKWDAGEQVRLKVTVNNDGSTALTNVTATVTSSTPGVVIADGTASYPNIPSGMLADSIAPHFTVNLPTGLACNASVGFNVTINSAQGAWNGTFSRPTGVLVPGGGTALNESFADGIPASWTVVNGGSGGGAAETWTTANPGGRTFTAPMVAPVAMVDSDTAGPGQSILQDEELITPVLDLSAATTATLQFDQHFRWYPTGLEEIADVDVRSSATGGAWVTVFHQESGDSPNPDHKSIDITAQAAGTANAQVRFHYWNGRWEWWWMVDNVRVDYTTPAGCNQTACAPAATGAKPVADGSFGAAMTASRANPAGTTIALGWDVFTCSSADHHVVYGPLASVSLATVSGSFCDLGVSGSGSWTGVPAGSLWFTIVGDDDLQTEGSWGTTSTGQRGGATASNQCGVTTRDNIATCP